MNKTIVVYKSRYGYTKKYAEFIAEELSCDLYERGQVGERDLEPYDTVIYGGGLYAGGVSGIDLLVKSFEKLKDKKLILFTCGLADTEDGENVAHIRENLKKKLPPEMMDKLLVFHLRGGMDYSKLGFVHRTMMGMLRRVMLKKDPKTLRQEDREMLNTFGKCVDFTDRATIGAIVRAAE